MDGGIVGQLDGKMGGWMDGGMSEWLDRVIDRGMCRGLDGRMEGCSGALKTGSHLKSSDLATYSTRVFAVINSCTKLSLGLF